MPNSTVAKNFLNIALDLFPEDRALLLRLAVADETFRSVCEDYWLASMQLVVLRTAPEGNDPNTIADYVTLVAELKAELSALVDSARRGSGPSGLQ